MYQIKSPAKLNLFLNLIGRNEKNYHLIESVMAFLDFYDEITIEEDNELSTKFTFSEEIKFPPVDENENSLIKIVRNFGKMIGKDIKLKISIKKNIPVGSGLGGGSSNAGVILKFLQNHYNVFLNKEDEINLALSIGCDTVACLHKTTVFVEGEGEIVNGCRLDNKLQNSHILLIYPQCISLSIEAYKLFKSQNMPFSKKLAQVPEEFSFDLIKQQSNDLTEATKTLMPELADLANEIEKYNLQENVLARMSGSGSTFFVLSDDFERINKINSELKVKFPNYFYVMTRILD